MLAAWLTRQGAVKTIWADWCARNVFSAPWSVVGRGVTLPPCWLSMTLAFWGEVIGETRELRDAKLSESFPKKTFSIAFFVRKFAVSLPCN